MEPARNNPNLLARYQELWRQSRRMQEAARESDWDLLIELEQERATINDGLMQQPVQCSSADQAEIGRLIHEILASDSETRLLVVPRQHELQSTFHSIDTEKKLLKAYDMIG
jgi:hypothetical protein